MDNVPMGCICMSSKRAAIFVNISNNLKKVVMKTYIKET